jgi:hypothetical protein
MACDAIADDEDHALSVINCESISIENKTSYISKLVTQINTLTNVADVELWRLLVDWDKIPASAVNVVEYFIQLEKQITSELIAFMNKRN